MEVHAFGQTAVYSIQAVSPEEAIFKLMDEKNFSIQIFSIDDALKGIEHLDFAVSPFAGWDGYAGCLSQP